MVITKPVPDMVNHPAHYERLKPEPIDVIENWEMSFNLGQVIKYIARAGFKDPAKTVEDLEKARFYLNREIDLKKEGKPNERNPITSVTTANSDGELTVIDLKGMN